MKRRHLRLQSAWLKGLLITAGLCAALSLVSPAYGMISSVSNTAIIESRILNANNPPAQSTPVIPDFIPPLVSYVRPPLYQVPRALRQEDHFYLTRPLQSGSKNWPYPAYRYGNTLFGRDALHTGVDMADDIGTPVVAAGSGNVIWTGFGFYGGVYDPDDNYGRAIAIHHDFGYGGQSLFTVYGHLNTITVWPGQRVETGQVIGTVGTTGHSTGPHLHFEVRLGDKVYSTTRNPELWMTMPEGWGVLAGRLENDWGGYLQEHQLRIMSLETSKTWNVWTYATDTLGLDPLYEENFAISDLPAGPYRLEIYYRWRTYTTRIDLLPGRTTFIAFHGQSGFIIEPEVPRASIP